MARLEPGIRIGNARHFHTAGSWTDRLRVNSGVMIDANRFWPREDWRPLSAEELPLLTTLEADSEGSLQLFNIPQSLHARWWEVAAAQASTPGQEGVAFRKFAGEMLEYLRFKRLPLPEACAFEVLVNGPGQPSVRPELGGLTAALPSEGMLGGVNLGDEEAALILLNLGAPELNQRLTRSPSAESFFGQVRAFLEQQPDYPLMRIALSPGEGYWLPAGQLAFDIDTRGRTEVDVQLLIRKVSNEPR